MNPIRLFLPFLSALVLSSAALAYDNPVIAKVGDSEVKAEDVKPYLEKLPVRDQLLLSKDASALNAFVRELIVQQLVYKEALSKKWDQQSQIQSQLDRVRQQAITQSYLQSMATPAQEFPTQDDLQAAYEALKKNNALQVPKQYHLSQIYVACPKGADKAVEEKAKAKLESVQKALKGGDFAAVAKSQSDDVSSSARGGDLGTLPENQIQPEILEAVTSLSKNSISDPVRLSDGWHILKVSEIKDPYTASLDEIRTPLANELRSQKAQILAKAYLAKLLQQNPVTLNEIAVSKLIETKGN
jgi:parvulin-like peptidyl-prolyl isomerase